jgi:colanic acid biosynthesis glycosyl transferase WcaI
LGCEVFVRILVHGINFPPEMIGVAKYTGEMCDWLANSGHTLTVVSTYPYYPEWQVAGQQRRLRYSSETIGETKIIRCPIYVPAVPTGRRRLLHHSSFAISSGLALVPTALRFCPDVVLAIAPSLVASPAAVLAARLSGAASWLHIQDFEIDAAFGLGLLSGKRAHRAALGLEARIFRRFDVLSSISPRMVERLAERNSASGHIVEFRNWVDTEFVVPLDRRTAYRSMLGISEHEVVVLYSGNMSVKQGLEHVVDAARRLLGKANIVFVFCGSGSLHQQLALCADGVANVRLLDLQPPDKLPELLATADIHILPQRAEAADLVLPSKLGGILASGRPVVAMAAAGSQLAIEVAGAGLTVTQGDSQAIADAIVRLAEQPTLRSSMGTAARNLALARWEKRAILTQFEARLCALVAERSRRTRWCKRTITPSEDPRSSAFRSNPPSSRQ